MGLFGGGGDANVNKHRGKRSGMFQRNVAKRKVELKEKKHENVKLEEDVPGAILPRKKPEECTIPMGRTNLYS